MKEVTISRRRPFALKALVVTSLSSSATNSRLFRSANRVHCAMRP